MRIEKVLAIPRSLFLNIRLFGFFGGGYKCPIIFSNKTKVKGLKKNNIIVENKHFGVVTIGFGGTEGIQENKTSIIIKGGSIIFKGKAEIAMGVSIRIDVGNLVFGDNFSCNKNCFIACSDRIVIGDNVLLGWNVNVRDNDGHIIYINGERKKSSKTVHIGNNVWIASYVDILKGVVVPDGCVIGYRSCLTNKYVSNNSLIVGYPAKEIQYNIEWKR